MQGSAGLEKEGRDRGCWGLEYRHHRDSLISFPVLELVSACSTRVMVEELFLFSALETPISGH